MLFLIQFAHHHPRFRLPELQSIISLLRISATFDMDAYSLDSPFMLIELPSWTEAKRLAERSILIKAIYELWGYGPGYQQVVEQVQKVAIQRISELGLLDASWRFEVDRFGKHGEATENDIPDKINRFRFLDLKGPVKMKDPDVRYFIGEDYGIEDSDGRHPKQVFMGLLVAYSRRAYYFNTFSLKTRQYIGITSFDAELSLVMANQAQAAPGKLILDPFVGTGSFLYACSAFGAYTVGSDLDGRQLRGDVKYVSPNAGSDSNEKASIQTTVEQYGLQGLVLDLVVCDNAHHPWRPVEIFDAIVCDPPYGVRAGAKKIGVLPGQTPNVPDEVRGKKHPKVVDYELDELVFDLLRFASLLLRPGGRLVYWLPVINDDFTDESVPAHPQLRLVAHSWQDFGRWSRRLITMEKIQVEGVDMTAPAVASFLKAFRRKYFAPATSLSKD